jgi:cytochrome c553
MSAIWSESHLVRNMIKLVFRHTRTTTPCIKARARSLMSVVGLQLALPLAIAAIAIPGVGHAKVSRPGVSNHTLEAKITYCEDCHGLSAQGFRGYYAIPRLAGQQPQYLKNQLRAFVERNRPNPIMSNVAHVLSPSMISAITAYFHRLNPRPYGGGPKRLVAAGRQIFQNGIPQANVAACAACHGPNATGHGEIPRLAGQLYWYVVRELTNWPKERGQNPALPDTSIIMKPVAHSLNRRQIEAVAAYVSYLR